MKIAQIGTFDLDNLGDLLFPWVTKKLIEKILGADVDLDYRCYSPTMSGSNFYPDQIPYQQIRELDNDDRDQVFDLVLIGGGDLVRDDDFSLQSVYGDHTPSLTFSHILSPTESSLKRLALLSVGVPYEIPDDFSLYLENSLCRAISAGVRDLRSAELLKHRVGITAVVVPDFVHVMPSLLPIETCRSNVEKLITGSGPRYYCFQGHADVCVEAETTAVFLKEIESRTGVPFILVEIGACLGDTEYLKKLSALTGYILVSSDNFDGITLEQKVSVLACCSGFIGSSLHGNIITNSYGVNNISYVGAYSHKIKEYFSEPSHGTLFETFEDCMSDADLVVTILSSPADESTIVSANRQAAVLNYLTGLLSTTARENAPFSSKVDRLYKAAHGNATNRELIVRDQLAALSKAFEAEKSNAKEQIEYRDDLVSEFKKLLEDEKANAQAQIEYRDSLIKDISQQLEDERTNARAQIEYRDQLVAANEIMLSEQKQYAAEQISQRDDIISKLQSS